MVSSTSKKIFSIAISLLVVVISLTGVASGATAPAVAKLTQYAPGFSGAPGKMARDAAGNFYVADFWGKRIVKFDRTLADPSPTFIATNGRPSAVAVLPDSRLVVAIAAPQPKVALYSQQTKAEIATFSDPAPKMYRPTAITVDTQGKIYVLDAGDSSGAREFCPSGAITDPGTANVGRVRVYDSTGAYLSAFGSRTETNCTASAAGEEFKFKQPSGIAFEKSALPNGNIVVVDTLNGRLQFFDTYGNGGAYVKSVGSTNGSNEVYGASGPVKFGNAVDAAFEYTSGGALNRIYVAERGRNEIVVVDPATGYALKRINIADAPNVSLAYPSSLLFEKTPVGGVLYTTDAPSATAADVQALGIDTGSIPVTNVNALTMTAVPSSLGAGSYTLSGTVSLANNAVNCSVNGVSGGPITTAGNGWSGPVTIVAGKVNYILCSSLINGVTEYKDAITYGDPSFIAPTLVITLPAVGTKTKDATVLVTGTSTVPNTRVTIANSLAGFTGSTLADAAGNWSAVVTLAEGSNVISVTGFYEGSLVSGPVTRPIVADYTAPSGTISFLANSATTVNAVQNIDGIIVDANVGTTVGSIEVNGVAVPSYAKVALSATDTYFSVPVTLGRGSNTITVTATDLLGYTATIGSRSVTLNPDLPGFTVALPGDNSYRNSAGTTAANGTADASYTSVTAGDKIVAPAGGIWSTPDMTVTGGFASYQVSASGSGPTVSEKRTINAAGAQLAITSPSADKATNSSSVIVSGNVAAGPQFPTISVDGGAAVNVSTYNSVTGDFSHTVTLSSQGPHYVKVTSNGTTAVRTLIYDTVPPVVSILANANATPSKIKGTIEPSAKITAIDAKLNGVDISIPLTVLTYEVDPASGSVVWTANLSAYSYDKSTLKFTAVDPAMNQRVMFFKSGKPTGDINNDGRVRLDDALAVLRHVAETDMLIDDPAFQADVGSLVEGQAAQDGMIDITDAVLILGKSYDLVNF